MSETNENPISEELLEILACPVCKTGVELIKTDNSGFGLKCSQCNRVYPIREGIPVMLTDEAEIKTR